MGNKYVDKVMTATGDKSSPMLIQGKYDLHLSGTWSGTIVLLRKFPENNSIFKHDGLANAAALTDSTQTLTADQLIGQFVANYTDGSIGEISDNTATVVTATLAGGTDNDWDIDDIGSLWSVVASYTANPDPQSTGEQLEPGVEYMLVAKDLATGTAYARLSRKD